MKVALFDIENEVSQADLEEAMDLVRDTVEYDLSQSEEGYFHCISRHPDYHVEILLTPEALANAKCYCAQFRKSKQCKHAIASLLLLRDHILRTRRHKSKARQEQDLVDEVLRKMNLTELRQFIASFALSHSAFRAEILANYLHLIRRPDYQGLLMELTPMDKFGNIKLNRNNLKTVRNITSTLLRQAQSFIKDKALPEALQILDPTLHHLYRLTIKVPQFQGQLMTELRLASRLFDSLCQQPMAPRLQLKAIDLAVDISGREGYMFIRGLTPLLRSAEPFMLEEKTRLVSFQLAERKSLSDSLHRLQWACLVMRWQRIWSMKVKGKDLKQILARLLPDIIHEFSTQSAHEDVIFALESFRSEEYEKNVVKSTLQTGLRAARYTGDKPLSSRLAYQLSLNFLDMEAWDILFGLEPQDASRIISLLHEYYTPGTDAAADQLIVHGYSLTGQGDHLLRRLKAIGDMALVMEYDVQLKEFDRKALEDFYASHIHEIREAYGGVAARQKLSNIFGHLKSLDIYTAVAEKVKFMEKKTNDSMDKDAVKIKGFVFDLDGVIVDTAIHHFQSWKKVMKQLGADITEEDDHHTRGASRMESLEYLINRYGIKLSQEEKEMWAARKNEIYLEAIEEITPMDLLPGALKFLIDSRKAGLLLALGSASKNARGVLKKLQIEDRFDAILDGNDAKESKPDPEIFTKACKALQLDPSAVVVFEDAGKGVQAAIAAGCKVVGIGDQSTLGLADIVISGLDQTPPTSIIEQLS